jgi:peptide/nickel transport system substrate-binding protein
VQDVALVPTHYQLNLWASRKSLKVGTRMDEMTLAQDISPEH